MAALLAWLGRRPDTRLAEGRFAAALARLAAHGPAGCIRLSLPGFELAWLAAGTPAEAMAGPPQRQREAPGLVGALTGWLWGTAEEARALGLDVPPADHTALLLAAVARRAQSGLLALQGAFAALVYDPRAHALLLRTDVAGQRALYVREGDDGCWVGSDEAGLLEACDPSALDPEQVARLLCALAPADDHGWFRGVRSVGAGQLWRVDGQGPCRVSQSALPAAEVARSRQDAVTQFRALQAQAVQRCAAGVPAGALGLSLSSGLDSLGVAAHLRAQSLAVQACSWSLKQSPASDESTAIAEATRLLDLPLHSFAADALSPLGGAPRRVPRGELLSNLYREIKQQLYGEARAIGVRVLLNGTGGDQLYGAPRWWLAETIARGHWLAALGELGWRAFHGTLAWRDPAVRQWGRSLLRRPPPAPALYRGLRPQWQDAVRSTPFDADPRRMLLHGAYAARAASAEHLHAEALGLELRAPWRDPDLMGYALTLPPHWLARRGQRKWLGRAALEGLLPDTLRLAPKRGDLTYFLRGALNGTLRERWRRLLTSVDALWPAYVQTTLVERALADPAGAGEAELLQLWLCVGLEHWREACVTRSA